MEDLFGAVIVIFGIVASIISSAKKEKEKKAAMEKHKAAAAARVQAAQKKQSVEAARPTTVLPPVVPAAPAQPIVPTVHTHLEPDCDTHDQPGSLGAVSTEGKDPCHEDQLTMERTFAEVPEQEGGLTFNWTGDSMVKAVIMQEVLTRPADRARTCQRYAR